MSDTTHEARVHDAHQQCAQIRDAIQRLNEVLKRASASGLTATLTVKIPAELKEVDIRCSTGAFPSFKLANLSVETCTVVHPG